LLDTHVFIWWCTDDRRLGARSRKVIRNAADVFVSAASAWEIAIKVTLGKLEFPMSVDEARQTAGFSDLPVLVTHADAVRKLERHHADPFDRLLITQARLEGLTLMTADRALAPYQVDTVWV
ncbi:MAG: type II toxin-antitoxin system VapC family toxin, partial [Polyangia bacterium]